MTSSSTSARTPMTGLVWRSARSASRISSVRSGSVDSPSKAAPPEGRLDQRREGLDVRTHHDDVTGLERRIVLQQMEDGVAQHLDLPAPAVARMHADAVVVRRRASGAGRRRHRHFPPATGRPGRRPGSARSSVGVAGRIVSVVPSPCGTAEPSTSCISRASRPHDCRRGCRAAPAVGSSDRST